jgi:hypothetical protein
MKEIAAAFQRTLRRVGDSLTESFAGLPGAPRWGVAGFGEAALVFLLAETMRAIGWECEYEQGYRDGTRRRGDLVARMPPNASLWVEAKWWWTHAGLDEILDLDRWKLEAVRGQHRPIAVVFTVDEVTPQGPRSWTTSTAEQSLRRLTPKGWKLVGLSAVDSPYRGTASQDRRKEDRNGVFAAAFFELTGDIRTSRQSSARSPAS